MWVEMVMAMGWRRITSVEFIGFLLLLSLASFPCISVDSDTKEGKCWYTLQVRTSKFWNAGTKDHVRVRIGDKYGTSVTVHYLSQSLEVNNEQPFPRDKTVKFNISGPCLKGEVCTLQFQVQGDDDWLVRKAIVQTQNNASYAFRFTGLIPEKTWHGFTCVQNEQLASDEGRKSLLENKDNIQDCCTRRRRLLKKSSKSPTSGGQHGNNECKCG